MNPTDSKAFATAGVLELGGGIGLSYTEPNDSLIDSVLRVSFDLHLGYFVTSHFSLGIYFGVPYTQTRTRGAPLTHSLGVNAAATPGFAVGLSKRVFLFGDLILGLSYVRLREIDLNRFGDTVGTSGVLGLFGAALGIKVVLRPGFLLRAAFRPTYVTGKVKQNSASGSAEVKSSALQMDFVLGFSGYL